MEEKYYTLEEISKWNSENSNVSLPTIQRGFVWKAHQVEALWDSIFRGYPLGAVMMTLEENGNKGLLDGQQRSTSIALGHFNPFKGEEKSLFSLKNYLPSIWIDLAPNSLTKGQKFVFRCLTQSHPWGYQLSDNSKTLEMGNRKNALDFFKTKTQNEDFRYTDLKSSEINPWDAHYPVPLAWLIEFSKEVSIEGFKDGIISKAKNLKIKTKYSNGEFVNYDEIGNEHLVKIYAGIKHYKKLLIPEIIVNSNVLSGEDETEETTDPTLFTRISTGGTVISGDELKYSIYKAHFSDVKNLESDSNFISPVKTVSIFSRLAAENGNDLEYQNDFKPARFGLKIKEAEYKDKLSKIISNSGDLLEKAIRILKNGDEQFPKVLLKEIVLSNLDLFYVLLSYLKNNPDVDTKEIAGIYVYVLWFNKDKKKIASQLFKLIFDPNKSWKDALTELKEKNNVLPFFKPTEIKERLIKIVVEKKIHTHNYDHKNFDALDAEVKEILHVETPEELLKWNDFINRIFWNKSFLLYAQKEYINSKFPEFNQIENIDDTNKPWDWDHIYPQSWVKNKAGINDLVRKWLNCNGNYRALSYDDNWAENNHLSPNERFQTDLKISDSFINENDLEFWNKIDHSYNRIKWDEVDTNKVENYLSAIILRMCNIYEVWCEEYFTTKS